MYKAKKHSKRVGVWMDHATAKVIDVENVNGEIQTIKSKHRSRIRIPGEGNDGSVLGAFRSTNSESNKNDRKMQATNAFYQQLAVELTPYDQILIMGPTSAPREFENFVKAKREFAKKKISHDTVDYITDNQIRHQVFVHYGLLLLIPR